MIENIRKNEYLKGNAYLAYSSLFFALTSFAACSYSIYKYRQLKNIKDELGEDISDIENLVSYDPQIESDSELDNNPRIIDITECNYGINDSNKLEFII